MRVYRKATCEWRPDGTLKLLPEESDSFEYYGPIAECKDAPAAPPPPDYVGAAEATAQSAMSDQTTPYGSLDWSTDADSPSGYGSTITLDPTAQETLDTQLELSNQMGDLALSQTDLVNQTYSQPMDLSSVQETADAAYAALTARLDPQWEASQASQENALVNQGLVPGGEGYDAAMANFNNAKTDAYQQANLAAIATMPQTYQLASSIYEQPLNQLNAIRTGAQIQNPVFTTTPTTDYSTAASQQAAYDLGLYNTGVASENSFLSGLMGLAGAGITAWSDW